MVVIFETPGLLDALRPLTYGKSVLHVRMGYHSLAERWQKQLQTPTLSVWATDAMMWPDGCSCLNQDEVRQAFSRPVQMVSSSVIPTASLVQAMRTLKPKEALFHKDIFVASCGHNVFDLVSVLDKTALLKKGFLIKDIDADVIAHLWDIIDANKKMLADDFVPGGETLPAFVDVVGGSSNKVHWGKNIKLYGRITINVEEGPVTIADGAVIKAPSMIEGPAYIGAGSHVLGARIRPYTSIGPICKVGGEVGSCIFEGYANKAHDGYVGDSYVGQWVNLGAMTTTSNLKNNYHPVKIVEQDQLVNTGKILLGSFIGDGVTLGIGTMIPTGTLLGPCVNFFGGAIADKVVPPFVWGQPGQYEEYDIKRAHENLQSMMQRRKQIMSDAWKQRWSFVQRASQKQRKKFLKG